jgi:hypothetical protein
MSYGAAAIVDKPQPFPEMRELKTHNHLLGDKAALDRAWDDDGYWFFKDVLDKAAVARLRKIYIEELEKLGVIDPVGDQNTERSVLYNGASLDGYPARMEPVMGRQPWKAFVAEPGIHSFFQKLFGEDPFWVPVVEYRATPPLQDKSKPRFDGIHQDGPFSPGIPFRICWFPLAEIDEDIGGLAFASELTEKINRHPLVNGSNTSIPHEILPSESWRRTTYEAGDVLLMNLWTPHSGLTNLSDRFRLSMDHRVMAKSDNCPIVGTVGAVSADIITIMTPNGERTLRIEDDTYVRNNWGQKLMGDEIAAFHLPGNDVIVACDGEKATVVRPAQG